MANVREENEETPRTMLMRLRSYGPDTEEVKARTVGMYKSPAHFAKRSRTPTSIKRTAEEAAGQSKLATSNVTKRKANILKETPRAMLMALRQYPDTEEVKARNVGMYKSPARSTKKPKTPTPVKRADEEPLDIEEDRMYKSPTPSSKRPKTPTPVKMRASESAGRSPSKTFSSKRTKSSLKSSGKHHNRRVSFGPVHEYHPKTYEESEEELDTIESEPENVIKEDVIDEVVQDASVADGDDYNNDISIESAHIDFSQIRRKDTNQSPLLETPTLLLERLHPRSKSLPSAKHKAISPAVPTTFTKKQFALFARKKISKEAADILISSTDNFIKHLSGELEAYALHAKRRKIDMSDVVLFMKRNKLLSENETFTSAANKYLCQEYVNEIVPVVDVINRETL